MWNVKFLHHKLQLAQVRDLIETLWNVKLVVGWQSHDEEIRFNRDIVECKAVSDACAVFSDSGFNRDIVECKGFSIEQNCRFLFDLIETLWNVKAAAESAENARKTGFNRDIVECKGFY